MQKKHETFKRSREIYQRFDQQRNVLIAQITQRLTDDLSHNLTIRDRIMSIVASYIHLSVNRKLSSPSSPPPPSVAYLFDSVITHINCRVLPAEKSYLLFTFLRDSFDKLSPIVSGLSVHKKNFEKSFISAPAFTKKYGSKSSRMFTTAMLNGLHEQKNATRNLWSKDSTHVCPMLHHLQCKEEDEEEDNHRFAIDLFYDGSTSPLALRPVKKCILCEFIRIITQL